MAYIIGQVSDSDFDLGFNNIIDKINNDKINFIKNRDKNGIGSLRVILGEIHRDPNKDYSEKNIKKILSALRKTTLKSPKIDTLLLSLIDTYIPQPISDKEVEKWFFDNYKIEDIKKMGKGAFKIIGEAKKYYKGLEFNANALKNIINEILNGVYKSIRE